MITLSVKAQAMIPQREVPAIKALDRAEALMAELLYIKKQCPTKTKII